MTNHDYLLQVIKDQEMLAEDIKLLQALRTQIESVIKNAFGSSIRVYYGGSYGKDTMIKS